MCTPCIPCIPCIPTPLTSGNAGYTDPGMYPGPDATNARPPTGRPAQIVSADFPLLEGPAPRRQAAYGALSGPAGRARPTALRPHHITPPDPPEVRSMPPTTIPKQLYRVPEAMHILSLSRGAVYELLRTGRLRSVKQGAARLVPANAITDYIALLEQEAATTLGKAS